MHFGKQTSLGWLEWAQWMLASENAPRLPGMSGSTLHLGWMQAGRQQKVLRAVPLPAEASPSLSTPSRAPLFLFGFVLRSAGVWYAATNWKIECDIKLIKTALCVLIFLSSFN